MTVLRGADADVLVIGGGLAGLRAAYDAARAGADVLVAVKGSAARSGSSAMTSAGYSSAVSEDDSAERHYLDTMVGGCGLSDPDLVRILVEEAPARLQELVGFGGQLAVGDEGPVVHPSGDHQIPRTVVAANYNGRDFTEPLLAAATSQGARLLEQVSVVDLLVEGGRVAGALAIRYADRVPSLVVIRAKAVILATGGAGHLFEVTSNPNDSTGDGYALALRASVALRDMEFIQFYPWRCIVPFRRSRMPIQPSTFVHGARLYNAAGERFMLRYDSERGEATSRAVAARGIYEQIRQGRDVDGGVVLDVSDVSPDDWRASNPKPAAYFERRGEDFRSVRMIIAPEAHFNMGGVIVDEHGATPLEGLYAVGETAGGVHGANRLDSNALPETQVFGARAGRSAAAHRHRPLPSGDGATVRHWTRRWDDLGRGEPDAAARLAALRRSLQATMWHDLGIVRSGERMAHGLDALDDLEGAVEEVHPNDARELRAHNELRNAILVCRASVLTAMARTESRGAHFRLDHPDTDPEWAHALAVRLDDDGGVIVEGHTTMAVGGGTRS